MENESKICPQCKKQITYAVSGRNCPYCEYVFADEELSQKILIDRRSPYLWIIPLLSVLSFILSVILIFAIPYLRVTEKLLNTDLVKVSFFDLLVAFVTGKINLNKELNLAIENIGAFYALCLPIIAFIVVLFVHAIRALFRRKNYCLWDVSYHLIVSAIEFLLALIILLGYSKFTEIYQTDLGVIESLTETSSFVKAITISSGVFFLISLIVFFTYSEKNKVGGCYVQFSKFDFLPSILGFLIFFGFIFVCLYPYVFKISQGIPAEYSSKGYTQADWELVKTYPSGLLFSASSSFDVSTLMGIIWLFKLMLVGIILITLGYSIRRLGGNSYDTIVSLLGTICCVAVASLILEGLYIAEYFRLLGQGGISILYADQIKKTCIVLGCYIALLAIVIAYFAVKRKYLRNKHLKRDKNEQFYPAYSVFMLAGGSRFTDETDVPYERTKVAWSNRVQKEQEERRKPKHKEIVEEEKQTMLSNAVEKKIDADAFDELKEVMDRFENEGFSRKDITELKEKKDKAFEFSSNDQID